jgi:beta-N-acetylhexosaminidase
MRGFYRLRNKIFILLVMVGVFSSSMVKSQVDLTKFINHPWVDSIFSSLSPDERIAQLIWINVNPTEGLSQQITVAEQLKKNNFGGLVFFAGTSAKQVELVNYYQSISKVPLIMAMDAEWGAGMRLDDVDLFPYNLTLGASSDDQLIQNCGAAMARQLKLLGIQVSLGPVADINTEPQNPIIGIRSFGESRDQVTLKSLAYMRGLQENGIIAVAKHYPGHGDTKNDSHFTLPLVSVSRHRLDSMELYPFRKLAEAGIGGIMTAHLRVPALDSITDAPSSLSNKSVEQVIRREWNYRGLIITDAMNMGGVTKYGETGRIEVLALKAGNDVIEYPLDGEGSIKAIKLALVNKELSWDEINLKCRRVLAAKFLTGLSHRQLLKIPTYEELNSASSQFAKRQIIESSITLLENKNQLIPIQGLDTLRIATLSIGSTAITPFQQMLGNYAKVDNFNLPLDFKETEIENLLRELKSYNLVITGVHSLYECKERPTFKRNKSFVFNPKHPYGVTEELQKLLLQLSGLKNSIVVFFANPYAVSEIKDFGHPDGLVVAYQNSILSQELAAQLTFGGISAIGKLPVSLGTRYSAGSGLVISAPIRLKYTVPEEVGLNSAMLNTAIDSVVNEALIQKAIPGCNILIAKDGRVVFQKAYGYQTYEQRVSSKLTDIYDLASITKVAGALPALMKLYEEDKYKLDEKFSTYWSDWRKGLFHPSNKSDLTLRELLSHQAGLTPFLPFWKETMSGELLSPKWYRGDRSKIYDLEVANGMFIDSEFKNHVYNSIRKSPLNTRGKYVYSDLSFIIYPKVIEKLSKVSYLTYLDQNFYQPLGAPSLTYLPTAKFPVQQIIPTEYDSLFRKQLLRGTVHDESSAVMGGISGNAGLFSSANDLAKIVQMYLQGGTYGGKQYLKQSTLEEFNKVQYPQNNNRRGLGFDKPLIDNSKLDISKAYPCPSASPQSFGHSGYTGTFFWADPTNGLLYIFLSNRVYPSRANNKLSDMNVRTNILQLVYDQIEKSKFKNNPLF